MITTFENETKPLTNWERMTLIPAMVKELSQHRSRRNAIKSDRLAVLMEIATGKRPNGARIRKVVNNIHINGYVPCLAATSDGYYIAVNINEIADCVTSLRQRARQIDQVANALCKQMRKHFPLDYQQKNRFLNMANKTNVRLKAVRIYEWIRRHAEEHGAELVTGFLNRAEYTTVRANISKQYRFAHCRMVEKKGDNYVRLSITIE